MVLSHNKLIVIGGGDGPDLYQAHAQISDQSAPPQFSANSWILFITRNGPSSSLCTSIIARVTSSICLTAFGW
jgi:hypothetical protein